MADAWMHSPECSEFSCCNYVYKMVWFSICKHVYCTLKYICAQHLSEREIHSLCGPAAIIGSLSTDNCCLLGSLHLISQDCQIWMITTGGVEIVMLRLLQVERPVNFPCPFHPGTLPQGRCQHHPKQLQKSVNNFFQSKVYECGQSW